MAQATCTAMNTRGGYTFAVRRTCSSSSKTCADICKDAKLRAQNPPNRTDKTNPKGWSCFNSLHIYKSQPILSDNRLAYTDSEKLGLATVRYNSCRGGCSPNYCCCRCC
jgi:hypothetical protein